MRHLVMAMLVTGLLAAPGAAEERLQLHRTTTLSVNGSVGITMAVPESTALDMSSVDISLGEDTGVAFVGVVTDSCGDGGFFTDDPAELCMTHTALLTSLQRTPVTGSQPDPSTIQPGLIDVYIIADGPAEITLHAADLDGAVEIEPTGLVQAIIEELPDQCDPVFGCTHGRGGSVHEIGADGGFAVSISVGQAHEDEAVAVPGLGNVTSSVAARACVYPGYFYPGAPTDPAEYPEGCDSRPRGDEPNQDINRLQAGAGYLAQTASFGVIERVHFAPWFAAEGEVYLGHRTGYTDPLPSAESPGGHVAWGLWVQRGITPGP